MIASLKEQWVVIGLPSPKQQGWEQELPEHLAVKILLGKWKAAGNPGTLLKGPCPDSSLQTLTVGSSTGTPAWEPSEPYSEKQFYSFRLRAGGTAAVVPVLSSLLAQMGSRHHLYCVEGSTHTAKSEPVLTWWIPLAPLWWLTETLP